MTDDTEAIETLGPSELGVLLGRSTKSIKLDATRRPLTLPPRLEIPGSRAMLWRVVDVREWMQALADIQADKRAAAVRLAQRTGGGHVPLMPIHIGTDKLGVAATERLHAKRGDGR